MNTRVKNCHIFTDKFDKLNKDKEQKINLSCIPQKLIVKNIILTAYYIWKLSGGNREKVLCAKTANSKRERKLQQTRKSPLHLIKRQQRQTSPTPITGRHFPKYNPRILTIHVVPTLLSSKLKYNWLFLILIILSCRVHITRGSASLNGPSRGNMSGSGF